MRAVPHRGVRLATAALGLALGVAAALPGYGSAVVAVHGPSSGSPVADAPPAVRPGSPDLMFGTAGTVVLPDVVDDGWPFTGPAVVPVAVAGWPGKGGASLVAASDRVLARTATGARADWFGTAPWAGTRRVPGQNRGAGTTGQAPGRTSVARMPDGGAVVLSAFNGTTSGGFDTAQLSGFAMRADGSPRPGWVYAATTLRGAVTWWLGAPARVVLAGAVGLPDARGRACVTFTRLAPDGTAVRTEAQLMGWTADGNPTMVEDWRRPGRVRLVGLAGCEGLAVDGSDRLLAAGPAGSGRVGVVRTSAAGVVDAAWGAGGTALLPAGVRLVPGRLVATARGTVYAGVSARTGGGRWAAGVAKLTAAGVLDPAFGAGGVALLPDPTGSSRLDALTTAPGGTLLAAATTASASGVRRHVLARVSAATGRLDRGFAVRGVAVLPLLPVDAWTSTAGGRAVVTLAGNTAAWRAGAWVPLRAVLHRRVL